MTRCKQQSTPTTSSILVTGDKQPWLPVASAAIPRPTDDDGTARSSKQQSTPTTIQAQHWLLSLRPSFVAVANNTTVISCQSLLWPTARVERHQKWPLSLAILPIHPTSSLSRAGAVVAAPRTTVCIADGTAAFIVDVYDGSYRYWYYVYSGFVKCSKIQP
jgi:hypothetical protein